MIFRDRKYDEVLHEALIRARVYTQKDFQALNPPPEGDLFTVLRKDPSKLNNAKWIHWLIKAHGFSRYNNPSPDMAWIAKAKIPTPIIRAMAAAEMFPLTRTAKTVTVAAARPDRKHVLQQLEENLHTERTFMIAVPPAELNGLHAAFADILRT